MAFRNREAQRAYQRAWAQRNRERVREYSRTFYWRHRDGERARHRRRKYGVDASLVLTLNRVQGGLCAICRKAAATDVDHDHRSGTIRGLLCNQCNVGLGSFKDDPSRLLAAAQYLMESGPNEVATP